MHYGFQRPSRMTCLIAGAVILLAILLIVGGLTLATNWTSRKVLRGYQVDQ